MPGRRAKSEGRTGSLGHVSGIVEELLSRREMQSRTKQQLCALVWGEVVGRTLADVSRVSRVKRGTAYVCCDSAGWAHTLQQQEEKILEKLRKRLGGRYVKRLRFSTTGESKARVMRVARAEEPRPAPGELGQEELSRAELESVESVVRRVKDPEVRERLRRVLMTERKSRQWRLKHGYGACAGCGTPVAVEGRMCFACEHEHNADGDRGGSMSIQGARGEVR